MNKIKRHLLIIYKQLMMSMKRAEIQQRKVSIAFNVIIADKKKTNKKSKSIVTDLFMRERTFQLFFYQNLISRCFNAKT